MFKKLLRTIILCVTIGFIVISLTQLSESKISDMACSSTVHIYGTSSGGLYCGPGGTRHFTGSHYVASSLCAGTYKFQTANGCSSIVTDGSSLHFVTPDNAAYCDCPED